LWTFTACDLFNLTLRPGLLIPKTSDDWLFAAWSANLTVVAYYILRSKEFRAMLLARISHSSSKVMVPTSEIPIAAVPISLHKTLSQRESKR